MFGVVLADGFEGSADILYQSLKNYLIENGHVRNENANLSPIQYASLASGSLVSMLGGIAELCGSASNQRHPLCVLRAVEKRVVLAVEQIDEDAWNQPGQEVQAKGGSHRCGHVAVCEDRKEGNDVRPWKHERRLFLQIIRPRYRHSCDQQRQREWQPELEGVPIEHNEAMRDAYEVEGTSRLPAS